MIEQGSEIKREPLQRLPASLVTKRKASEFYNETGSKRKAQRGRSSEAFVLDKGRACGMRNAHERNGRYD